MRRYEQTHPWLTFEFDANRLSSKIWMALGEAQSRCEHIAGVPLPPNQADHLHRVYLAKGVHATTAIEGNTLSEDEVQHEIQGSLKLPESKQYLGQEIKNILDGCNEMLEAVAASDDSMELLSVETIRHYNRLVLRNLDLDNGVQPGEIPTFNVVVANYRGAPREDCDYLLARMCDWLNHATFVGHGPDLIVRGILRAILAHLYLVWIHPFADGNGRTSRLIEYQILLSAGVPSPAAHLLSNHYNETRTEYYRQLDRSSKGECSPVGFIEYAVRGFVDGLRTQLERIRDIQWEITWHDYVHYRFKGRDSVADVRQRHLVLDLSEHAGLVPRHQLPLISPRIAQAYARKGEKTLSRDIRALVDMGLIASVKGGYVARKDVILAFRPLRRIVG
jgi:Fic family protein